MELVQPLASTAVRFVSVIRTEGPAFVPDIVASLKDRYRFWKAPQTMEEYSHREGAEFRTGLFEGVTLTSLRLFAEGVVVEAAAHTDLLDAFLDDVLAHVHSTFGMHYEPKLPLSRGYTSTIEVSTSASLDGYLSRLDAIATSLTETLRRSGFETSPYKFSTLTAISDPTKASEIQPGRFIFDRRAGRSFESDIFYSEAPLSTKEHMRLLGELEAILTAT